METKYNMVADAGSAQLAAIVRAGNWEEKGLHPSPSTTLPFVFQQARNTHNSKERG